MRFDALLAGALYLCLCFFSSAQADMCDCAATVPYNSSYPAGDPYYNGLCMEATRDRCNDVDGYQCECTLINTVLIRYFGGGAAIACTSTLNCTQVCPTGSILCGDPHMQGLSGQKIDWSGMDGGWYSLVLDDEADLAVNVRLTAPMPDTFPNRQLITGLSVMSEGHSLVIEVKNPYDVGTDGCPQGISPCLADGGLVALVDGKEVDDILRFSRQEHVANGIHVSASNLPVECRQFGGDKIWARMQEEMLLGMRQLTMDEPFEDWILRFDSVAAPDWCTKYIAENDLADLQSTHAVFKIETHSVTVRLNVGVNYQTLGELDWDGRILPDLEFWQMDVGFDGLSLANPLLSGILGETARPVYDENGRAVMEGFDAFRGSVEDYRLSGCLGTHFDLLDEK